MHCRVIASLLVRCNHKISIGPIRRESHRLLRGRTKCAHGRYALGLLTDVTKLRLVTRHRLLGKIVDGCVAARIVKEVVSLALGETCLMGLSHMRTAVCAIHSRRWRLHAEGTLAAPDRRSRQTWCGKDVACDQVGTGRSGWTWKGTIPHRLRSLRCYLQTLTME